MLPCGESVPPDMLGTGRTAAMFTDLDPEEITTELLDVYAQRTPMCVLVLGGFSASTINLAREGGDSMDSPRGTHDIESGALAFRTRGECTQYIRIFQLSDAAGSVRGSGSCLSWLLCMLLPRAWVVLMRWLMGRKDQGAACTACAAGCCTAPAHWQPMQVHCP